MRVIDLSSKKPFNPAFETLQKLVSPRLITIVCYNDLWFGFLEFLAEDNTPVLVNLAKDVLTNPEVKKLFHMGIRRIPNNKFACILFLPAEMMRGTGYIPNKAVEEVYKELDLN